MPFPLAHPAVVLPLKRFCPRWLDFPALVVGSLCPDLGYAFRWLGLDECAHQFLGSLIFCLPAGVLWLESFARWRAGWVRRLPGRLREVVQPLCRVPLGSPGVVLLSLLVGAWTHVALDSFTNQRGEAAMYFGSLQVAVASVMGHDVKVCHLLWYALSFTGIAWLILAYELWVVGVATGRVAWRPGWREVVEALAFAGAILPIGLVHHLDHGWTRCLAVGALSLGWVAVLFFRLGKVMTAAGFNGMKADPNETPAGEELAWDTRDRWFARRGSWAPTWRLWGIGMLCLLGAAWVGARSANAFLSVTQRIPAAEVLVVEGWLPDYAMPEVMTEFEQGGYRWLVASGHTLPAWWTDQRYQTGAEITAATLVALGLATNYVVALPPNREVVRDRTYSSALTVRRWLASHQTVKAINVYSLGAHSRRTRLLFEQALGTGVKVGIIAHATDNERRPWWASAHGFTEVLSESAAYLYARMLFHPAPVGLKATS